MIITKEGGKTIKGTLGVTQRVSEAAERASETAGRASKAAKRALEPRGWGCRKTKCFTIYVMKIHVVVVHEFWNDL